MMRLKICYTFIIALLTGLTANAQITINTTHFATSGYGPSSDIAVPIRLTGCFNFNNRFILRLSDSNGNFAPGDSIGGFNGFFTPFINGRIKVGTPPSPFYRIKIESTNPVASVISAPITIVAGTGSPNDITSPSPPLAQTPEKVFGRCSFPASPTPMIFQNQAGNTFSHIVIDSIGNTVPTTLSGNQVSLNPVLGNYYTFLSTIVNAAGVRSTRGYLILASTANLASSSGGTIGEICFPDSRIFNINGSDNPDFNYPGTTYTFAWGDGLTDSFTHCQVKANNWLVLHQYNRSSCGELPVNIGAGQFYYNSFETLITAKNSFCNNFRPKADYTKVFERPIANFTNPQYVCQNVQRTISNTSTLGLAAPNNAVQCGTGGATFQWYVNGQFVSSSQNLTYNFPRVGTDTIKLIVENEPCTSEITQYICIEPPPIVDYYINGNDSIAICTSDTVYTDNQSSANNCRGNIWKWRVCYYSSGLDVDPNSGIYTIVPNDTTFEPYFIFHQPGLYIIHLGVTNSCGTFSKDVPRIVNVLATAGVSFPADTAYCGKDTTINFGTNPLHRPTYNSTQGNQSYLWKVTGGGYSFVSPTDSTSRFPIIRFQDYGLYTVQVRYTNNCGTQTATQRIRFSEGLTVQLTPDTICRCSIPDTLILNAQVTGTPSTQLWTSTGTGSFSPANATVTIYNLSAADKASGTFKLYFKASTQAPTACPPAVDSIFVQLYANNAGRDSVLTICSNTRINYLPSSNQPNSTQQWTSQVISGTVTGNTPSGSGIITDSLINASNTTVAVVEYTITPVASACAGIPCNGMPYTLRVTVNPKPTITAVPIKDSICSGDSIRMVLGSSIANSQFTWSVALLSGNATGFSAGTNNTTTGNANIALPPVTSTNGAVLQYVFKSNSGGCSSDSVIVRITVLPGVSAANAGPDIRLCNAAQTILAATAPTIGTGVWQQTQGLPVTLGNPNAANTQVSGLVGGQTYTFRWTVAGIGSACPSNSDEVVIINDTAIGINTITPPVQNICINDPATITGSTPVGGNLAFAYEWIISTDNISYAPLQTPAGPNVASLTQVYTQTAWLKRIVVSGACRDTAAAVQVVVNGSIANNVLPADRDICTGTATGNILGSVPQGGGGGYTYTWQQSPNGLAPWDNINGATQADYDPGIIAQSTCFRRLISTPACGNSQAISNPICITIRPNAQANFTARDTLLCAGVRLDTVITVVPFSGNSTYQWFADGVALAPASTNSAFPGFTIATANDTVVIRLDVVSAFGCQPDSKSIRFITRPNVVPSFTIGNTADSCGPRAVTITNTSSILDSTVRFTWDFGNGQTSISTQPGSILFAANPLPRDTIYYIILRADNRCTVVTYRDSVVVKSKPRAGFTPSRTVGCSPFRDTLVNGSSLNSDRFLWDYGNGVNFITTKRDTFLVANYNTAIIDTFRIRLIAENGCGRDTAFVDVVVSPNTIQAAITVSGPSQEICAPGVATFLNASIGAAYLKWDYGDGSPIDSTNNIPGNYFHTYTNPGTYFLSVRLVNSCTDTSITRTVVVYPKPKAQFTVIPAVPICTGDSIVTNNSSTGANAYEWIWGDGSPNSNAFNATHVFTQAGTYTVRLIAKKIGLLGLLCTDTAAATVQAIARIPAQIVLTNISPLCAPNAVLSLAAPGTAAAASVQWVIYDTAQPGGQVILNGSAVAYPIQQAGNYLVKLYVTNSANCTDSASSIFTVFPRPKLSFVADTLRTCNRDTTIRFVATTTYAGPGTVAVTWLINGVVSGSGNPYFHRFTIPAGSNQAVNFTVQAVATAVTGCTDTTATSIFTILPTPRPKIIVSPTTVIRQPDNSFTFKDTNAVNVNYDWQWSMGDQINRSGNPITHEYGNTGSYWVKLRLADFLTGCSGKDSVRVTIEPVPGYLYVPNAFYPNSLKMELRKFLPKGRGLMRYQLQIYDGLGKLIFETTALDADGRPSQGWDGTFRGQAMPQDAYLWVIRVADFKNGTEWNGMKYSGDNKPHSSGSVTLFR